jgi:hypothetical protein
MFGVRSFPAARCLEDVFEQAFLALAHSTRPEPQQKATPSRRWRSPPRPRPRAAISRSTWPRSRPTVKRT